MKRGQDKRFLSQLACFIDWLSFNALGTFFFLKDHPFAVLNNQL